MKLKNLLVDTRKGLNCVSEAKIDHLLRVSLIVCHFFFTSECSDLDEEGGPRVKRY